jgi:hypothetical protein
MLYYVMIRPENRDFDPAKTAKTTTPKDAPAKPAAGGAKVDASAKELEAVAERDKNDPAKTPEEMNARAGAVLDKIKANHTPEEIHELAKRLTGKRGRAKDASDSLRELKLHLTTIARSLGTLRV